MSGDMGSGNRLTGGTGSRASRIILAYFTSSKAIPKAISQTDHKI